MSKNTSYQELINSETLLLVDFTAAWCGPCKAMAPVLSDVAKRIGSRAKIVKIDVDKNQQLAQQLNVRGVPTFILYKNGEIVWRASGMQSSQFLTELLEEQLETA